MCTSALKPNPKRAVSSCYTAHPSGHAQSNYSALRVLTKQQCYQVAVLSKLCARGTDELGQNSFHLWESFLTATDSY